VTAVAHRPPAGRRASGRPSTLKRLIGSEHLAGWMFVTPAVILIAIFFLIPIGWSLILSLQANNLLGAHHWVGLANYRALSRDHVFRSSVGHTLLYTVIFVPISVVGALALAVALNRRIRGIRFYRLAIFTPLVTSTVATGILFLWLLDPTFGLVNYVVHALGLPQQQFLQSHVVWSTINALQLFDEIYVTTRGGPLESTTVIVYYLYQQAFQYFNAGYGSAIAYILFIAILLVTLVQMWIGRRRVYYTS
jgi:ABC-type sugar transport system permease subunit